jgi:hypothetical protein
MATDTEMGKTAEVFSGDLMGPVPFYGDAMNPDLLLPEAFPIRTTDPKTGKVLEIVLQQTGPTTIRSRW